MEQTVKIGKYRVQELIASGGMGHVLLARHEGPQGFSKKVVLKLIRENLAEDPSFVDMFFNEAKVAALLEHPNIVQIFELGEDEGRHFIAMEFIHGPSLRRLRLRLNELQRNFPALFAARVCADALRGLHHAHELRDEHNEPLRIVHRDVSPDNVLVTFNGIAKVLDFGIAKATVNASTTRTGTVKGKYAYMSPEQIQGKVLDHRADIYAMGVLMYELLTNVRPFHADSDGALLRAILDDEVRSPREIVPELPELLEMIVLTALSRDRDARFQTAEEMALALESFVASADPTFSSVQVAALLKELFPKDANMRTTQAGTGSKSPLPRGIMGTGSLKSATQSSIKSAPVPIEAGSVDIIDDVVEVDVLGRPVRPQRSRGGLAVVALSLGLAVGAVAVAYVSTHKAQLPPEASAAVAALVPQVAALVPEVTAPGPQAAAPAPLAAIPAPQAAAPLQRPEALPSPAAEQTNPALARVEKPKESPAANSRKAAPPKRPTHVVATPAAASAPSPVVTAAATVVAPAVGTVALRVNPWAEVFLDGRNLGVTPFDPIEVSSGRRRFVLKNSELGLERVVEVNVPSGGQVVLKADLLQQ